MSLYSALRPLLFALPPETAHALTLAALRVGGIALPEPRPDHYALRIKTMGLNFSNPFGVAAGFDKNAIAMRGMLKLGFGFSEIGTVTPLAQAGNPRPRIFRLRADEALINRLGFNNRGQDYVAQRLQAFRNSGAHWTHYQRPRLIGANIGAQKDNAATPSRARDDYAAAARALAPCADYLTMNLSSPNTPHLRDLQSTGVIADLIMAVREAAPTTPLLIKLAPDLESAAACDIAALAAEKGIAGLIIANTTTARPELATHYLAQEEGGLSGTPLFAPATALLSDIYRATQGALVLVGVGGIATPAQAYAKIRAGASLLQVYTGLVYHGAAMLKHLKSGLVERLHRDGFATLADAVGADHKINPAHKPK